MPLPQDRKKTKKRQPYGQAYVRPGDGYPWIEQKRRPAKEGGVWTSLSKADVETCLYKAAKHNLSVEKWGHLLRIVKLYAFDKLRAGHYFTLTGNDVLAIQSRFFTRPLDQRVQLRWACKVAAAVCRIAVACCAKVRFLRTVFNAKVLCPVADVGQAFKKEFASLSLRDRDGRPARRSSTPTGPPATRDDHTPD